MACNTEELLAQAAANGYLMLDDRNLLLCILQLLCAASNGGAFGGVSSGSGVPTFTPGGGTGMYIQIDSIPPGEVWEYFNGAWH